MADESMDRVLLQLQDIEERSKQHAAGLPTEQENAASWEGVLFNLSGRQLIAPLNEVKEILNHRPMVTRVPESKGSKVSSTRAFSTESAVVSYTTRWSGSKADVT